MGAGVGSSSTNCSGYDYRRYDSDRDDSRYDYNRDDSYRNSYNRDDYAPSYNYGSGGTVPDYYHDPD